MVFTSRLYGKTVYRLALYQVLTGWSMASLHVTQVVIIHYYEAPSKYRLVCEAIACLSLFAEWSKLLFTTWATFHLCTFVLFQRNLKRWEAIYVSTSVIVPAMIASVPFVTNSYGLAGSWCWITTYNASDCKETQITNGIIEQFALWYGPSSILLFAASVAMVSLLVVVARRLYKRRLDPSSSQHRIVLKQLIPLAIYPIIYFLFNIPPFVYRLYRAVKASHHGHVHDLLAILTATSTSAWCLAAGLTLICHIITTKSFPYRQRPNYVKVNPWM